MGTCPPCLVNGEPHKDIVLTLPRLWWLLCRGKAPRPGGLPISLGPLPTIATTAWRCAVTRFSMIYSNYIHSSCFMFCMSRLVIIKARRASCKSMQKPSRSRTKWTKKHQNCNKIVVAILNDKQIKPILAACQGSSPAIRIRQNAKPRTIRCKLSSYGSSPQ